MQTQRRGRLLRVFLLLLVFLLGLVGGAWLGGYTANQTVMGLWRGVAAAEFWGLMDRMAVYHAGDSARAVELFEQGIDNYILTFAANPDTRQDEEAMRPLQLAKVYRQVYPSTASQAGQVEEVLDAIPSLEGDEAWLANTRCNPPLLQLVRSQTSGEPKPSD